MKVLFLASPDPPSSKNTYTTATVFPCLARTFLHLTAPTPTKNNAGIPCDSCQMDPNALGLFITFQSPSHSLGRSPHFRGISSCLCSIGELKPANVASPQLDLTLHPALEASVCQAFGATSSPKTGAKRAPT